MRINNKTLSPSRTAVRELPLQRRDCGDTGTRIVVNNVQRGRVDGEAVEQLLPDEDAPFPREKDLAPCFWRLRGDGTSLRRIARAMLFDSAC